MQSKTKLEAASNQIRRRSQKGEALQATGGTDAFLWYIAERYVGAFENLAKEGTTILLPTTVNNPSSMIAQALSVFMGINKAPQSLPQAQSKHLE